MHLPSSKLIWFALYVEMQTKPVTGKQMDFATKMPRQMKP